MTPVAAALVGSVLGAGMLLLAAALLGARRPRLADRIRGIGPAAPRAPVPGEAIWAILRPGMRAPAGAAGILERLARAGRPIDARRHRLEQVAWAGAGAAAGLLLGIAVLARGASASPVLLVIVAGLFATAAVILHDRRLASAARQRGRRMGEQLPTVADMLAFSVSAGEPPLAAVERVARTISGDLADEMGELVADVRGGEGFIPALRALGRRCPSPAVGRFVDGIAIASERGTPIAEVLRAQAADARAAGRRALMESAGRREIAMLVPVVFLILPVIVVIALFPGIHGFTVVVP